jgi:hypothetical protein
MAARIRISFSALAADQTAAFERLYWGKGGLQAVYHLADYIRPEPDIQAVAGTSSNKFRTIPIP